MGNNPITFDLKLIEYLKRYSVKESKAQKALREITNTLDLGSMQVAPEQAEYLKFLIHSHQIKSIIEIGTFTGYSALAMAQALPSDGKITCLEINENWSKYALPHWQQAGVIDKISLEIAPANDTLENLFTEGKAGSYDFAFIDADKTHYQDYYDACYKLVRQGGIIAIDNIFWDGRVADENNKDRQTQAIRNVTEYVYNDKRVKSCIIPIGDGMMLAYKL